MITNLSFTSVERQLNPVVISGDRTERKKSPASSDSSSRLLTRQLSNGDLPSVLFVQNFAKYLKSGQYSDFTIKLKFSGQEFRVHKVFISHLSEYFQSLLSGAFNESQNNFVVLELNSKGDEEIFPAILNYMYTGEITLTLANVVHIIIIADRLLMAALKKKAVKYLERMLKPCIAHEPPFIWESPLQELVSKIVREAVDYRFDEGDELLQRAVGLLVRILQMHLEKFRGDIGLLPPSLFSLVIKEQSQSLIESCLCEYLANSKSHLTKEDFEIIMSHLERISLVNAPLFVDLAMHFDSKTVKTKALNVIVEEFGLFKQDVNLICQLPFDMLVKTLKSDRLQIEHEDELYNFVKFLIEFNEASASAKPRKASASNEKPDRERFFANGNGNDEVPSIAKALGSAFAHEQKSHHENEESNESELIRTNFTKWNKKQHRELWETVRWAFCLPETLQAAANSAPDDLVTKGRMYSDGLLGGVNFESKTRNHRVRGSLLIGRCMYDEQVESSARQAIKVSETPRYEYDSETSSSSGERTSNGSNNSPMPSPHIEGSKIDVPSHGVFWWLGSGANSRIYRNPVSSGLVEISCNMGFFDSSNGSALVSKTKQSFYTNSGSGVAIVIALNGFEIWPTHYSLTHGDKTNQHALTSWSFQGSRNNSTWQVLSEHRKNTQLHSKFARAVFPLKTKDAEIPRDGTLYNRFRIVLLEPNSSGQYEISLSDIEIYGRVRGHRRNLIS